MTALLTDNLPLLASAPNGIKKLRELILELAVRGKLVPQDPNDEPASELLKRVAEEKARLFAAGKIKKKSLLDMTAEEQPFQLPSGWGWCKLSELLPDFQNGASSRGDANGINVTVLRLADIKLGEISLEDTRSLALEGATISKHSLQAGDILLIRVNGSADLVGRFIVCRNELQAIPCDHFIRMRLPKGVIDSAYLKIVSDSAQVRRAIAELFVSTAGQKTVNQGHIGSLLIPLPPLAQQNRIVAKVDELMALCDRLEAQQADAESAHAQLVHALLGSLTQAVDAEDFAASWQRLAEHFHTLFTSESSIDALKQTLLQLAVMGKLAPQDPNDEPASELLRRIADESTRLVAGGKAKKGNVKTGAVAQGVDGFEIPATWAWTKFDELINPQYPVAYGVLVPGPDVVDGVPFVRIADLDLVVPPQKPEKSISPDIDRQFERTRIRGGEILMGVVGSIGKLGIAPESWAGANIARAICRLVPSEHVSKGYIIWLLQSDLMRKQFLGDTRTLAQPTLNVGLIRNASTPLPPLTEQHRIVAKVDQLMALCDQLKARLTQARQLNEQLATALAEQAVADESRQSPNISDQKTARTLLAAEITHQLHGQRTFGQRKLQKAIYLAEHTAKLAAIKGNYLRNVAGPHDRQLMDQAETGMHMQHWYERIERDTVGHAYRPLAKAGQHRQAYENTWSTAERATIEQVIALMRDWDTDRCEMIVTLYAAWNDFILEGRPVTDDAIVAEVMHRWNDAKLRFTRAEWLAVLAETKKHSLLTPNGFGKRTVGGTLALPGFE